MKVFSPVFIGLVGIEPAGFLLALARGLQRIGLHPLDKGIVAVRPRGQAPSSA